MINTARKNRSGNSHAGYAIRVITHGFFGAEKLTASERAITNALYSFTQKGGNAEFTYPEIGNRYNISTATVSRTMRKILQFCFEKASDHTYKLKELLPAPDKYFYIYDWLWHAKFPCKDGNEVTDLTNDQVEVLSYIIHQNHHIRHWTSTQASIARTLEIAASTVSEAVSRLEDLRILTVRTVFGRRRSVNNTDRATFTLDYDLLKKIRLETLRNVKAASHAVRDADARADRERFYKDRQKLANEHADSVREKLGQGFAALETELKRLEMEAGKAQAARNMKTVREILEKKIATKAAIAEFLKQHGYTAEDLQPRYLCPDCCDTGFRKDGTMCSCYTPPGGTP